MTNYATRKELDHAIGDISYLASQKDLIALKAEVDKLDINKLVNVPTSLINLKTKVDGLDIGKLKTVPVVLKKVNDVVDNEVVENIKFNTLKTKVNNLERKIPDATTIIHINQYNTDKQNLEKKTGDVDKKVPYTNGLVTTIVLNTKLSEVENKIPNHDKYITTSEFNKLTAETFTTRLKQAIFVTKTYFEKKLARFNRKITSSKTKYLEVEKKLNNLITKDYNFFLGRIYFTSNDGSQNIFVYQPTLDSLELKKYKGADYILSWKSNGVLYKPLYTAFLHSVKLSGYKMGIKFDKDPLSAEQNNYVIKIVNVYIVYELYDWSKTLLKNFTLKNCLFGVTNIVKNSDKYKWVYSGNRGIIE